MSNVTIKDTKQVIFEAYQEAVSALKAARDSKFDPNTIKKEKADKETIKKAESIVEMNILNEEIVSKYDSLKEAIALKEDELREYYGIERDIDTILALVEAKKAIEAKMDCDYAVAENEWENKIADLKSNYKTTEEDLRKERKREIEEYNYNLKRARQLENDKWEDEKNEREAELTSKEVEVAARERAVKETEVEFLELTEKVAEIPNLIAKAVEEAKDAVKSECDRKHAIEKSVIKREVELDKTLLEKELEAAKAAIARLEEENKSLANKLEVAQDRVQTIATETVKASQPRVMSNDK